MSSTVACIGFTDPSVLANLVRESGEPFHELSSTLRWQDSSGATLLLDRTAQYARPGFTSDVRSTYSSLTAGATGLATIGLQDAHGYELGSFTVVPDARYTTGWSSSGRVALVAMGIDVEFFPTAEDFFDSPRSALPGMEGEPPPEVRQFGLPWPPPMEIQTFLPSEKENDPTATLSGTVQWAQVRTNTNTGHEFLVARIATSSGEIDLCTPLALDGVPEPGYIMVGQVQLLAGFTPFGQPDTSTYTVPEQQVQPNYRDGVPNDESAVDLDAAPIDLPEGLVLGDDGIVRTTAEHAEWKGGNPDAGGAPKAHSGQADEAHSEDEHDERSPFHGRIAPDEPASEAAPVVNTSTSTGAEAPSVPATSAEMPSPDEDLTPRPGETRREWRARTGR